MNKINQSTKTRKIRCCQVLLCLAPDVEVGMNQHHHGAYSSAALKQEDPAPVKEKEHGEAELHRVPKGADVVDPVVQALPHAVLYIERGKRNLSSVVQRAQSINQPNLTFFRSMRIIDQS